MVWLPAGQFLGRLVGWRLTFAIAAAVTLLVVVAQAVVLPGIPPDMSTHLGDLVGVVKRRAARRGMAAGAVAFIGQFTAWTYINPVPARWRGIFGAFWPVAWCAAGLHDSVDGE